MPPTIKHRWNQLLGWIACRPRAAAIVSLLLLVVVGGSIREPIIEGSMVDQLSGSNAQLEVARRIVAASGDETMVAIIMDPADVSIGEIFADLSALRGRLLSLDDRIRIRSIDDAADQMFAYDLEVGDPGVGLLAALRDNPDAGTIINAAASRFLVVVTLPAELEPKLVDAIAAFGRAPSMEGITVLAGAQLEADVAAGLAKDLRLLIPVIVAVTLLALFVAFGYWRALFLPLYASIASTVATFALFSTMVVTINLVTLIALPVVLIVGLANSCHFLAKSSAEPVAAGDVADVVKTTLQRVGPPFFYSTLTTSIALASLSFNELPPIAHLGLLSAGALLIVFLLVLLAAPLLLTWYLGGASNSWRESSLFGFLSRRLAAGRAIISSLLLLAMLGGAISVPLLTVKSDPRAFFPDDAPFSSALELFEREFYVFSPLRALVIIEGDDRLAGLRAAGVIRDSLARHDGLRRVSMRPAVDDKNAYVLSGLLASGDDLARVSALLERHAASPGIELIYTNAELVYGDIDRQAMESLLRSLAWSVALIFGAILVLFRSARTVLSALLANAVPLMLVCGAVWLIGNPLNLVTVFVFLVALGVIVDDSIHILFWRATGDAVSGSSIEFSVLLSTLMLCLGLLLCQLSDFPTTRMFAAYCALALLGAVVSNLTVLPLLLRQPMAREEQG
jgi:predicted RND superfamily exporter protein